MGRRLARELALKILYSYEESDINLAKISLDVLDQKNYTNGDKKFSKQLIERTINNLAEIDRCIVDVVKNWPYDRVSVIDKTILRLGACEILYFEDIPSQVSINEAIEISKKYGGANSSRFVNGILDAVKKNYESSDHK